MKTGTLATKLMLAAIFAAVFIYFGLSLAAYFANPFTTSQAYPYVSENAAAVSGYVVRSEQVLPGQAGELVYVSRSEGERVSAGGTVAQIYQSAQSLGDANTLRSLTEQLEQLLYAQSLTAGTQTELRLEEEVASSLTAFHSTLASGNLTAAANAGGNLRAAVLKRSYVYSGAEDLSAAVASLQAQIASLSAAGAGTQRVTAPQSGLFSGMVDGYESVLTLEAAAEMTPSQYKAIAPAPAEGLGRIVLGTRWAFVTLMSVRDMGRLQAGDTVTLRFQTGLDRDMTMKVTHISAEEAGQKVVTLESEEYLNLTTLLRRQNAQLIFDSYTGIRVPRAAVRLGEEPVTDEEGNPVLEADGTPRTRSITGVYCVWGTFARFKPVEVVWQEEDYMLVRPAEGTGESRRLRSGDTVIIAAVDLYDGKVING
ncbi:MAG: hypothetical protein HFF78_02975 [Oscillospiraceae bacterium]|nr:hypothetical protein [Oscillospiraceae bacterium]